jgi:hypothetical protein
MPMKLKNKQKVKFMAEQPKKRFVDPYTTMSTKDLIGKIEGYYADTEDAINKRAEDQTSLESGVEKMGDVESKYLLGVRGEHGKFKGKPKSKMLDSKNAKVEATELIYNIALEGIRGEFGEDAAKFYQKNPNSIKHFLASKGIDFYGLRKDMVENRRSFTTRDSYRKFKQQMAAGGIERIVEQDAVERELKNDTSHHENYFNHVSGRLKNSGYELGKAAPIDAVIDHHKAHLGNQFTTEYALNNDAYLKKAAKK